MGQKMRLTGVGATSGGVVVASSDFTFDSLGRVTQNTEIIAGAPGSPYSMHYAYNANDTQASLQYALGRTVTTCYDVFGRAVWASAVKQSTDCVASQGAPPASATGDYGVAQAFFPPGQTKTMALGNGLTEAWDYNNRQQPESMQLSTANANCPASNGNILTLGYGYATGLNNGNVQTQTIGSMTAGCQPASLTQTYGYDSLNRLTGVTESGGANAWQEGYAYDQWGNVMLDAARTTCRVRRSCHRRRRRSTRRGIGW